VRSDGIVVAEIVREGERARLAGAVGLRVGPLREEGADEAFGLAVRARRLGPRAQMAELMRLDDRSEHARAIRRAVVGHDPRDRDAAPGEMVERAAEEPGRGGLGIVGQDLGIPEPGAVVDGHLDGLPPEPARAAGAVGMNAMPDATDLAQLLDVQMQAIAGRGPFVAVRWAWGIQSTEAIEPEPPLLAHDRAEWQDQLARNPGGAAALPPPSLDPSSHVPRRSARAIHEPRRALRRLPLTPLLHGLAGHAELRPSRL
jgi:hypothetical protein